MLFLPDSVLQARRRIMKDLKRRRLTEEQAFRKALELDPFDSVGMAELGRLRHSAGDLREAEQWLWRAIEAAPSRCAPYMGLATVLSDSHADETLTNGVSELGFRLLLLDEETLDELESVPSLPGSEEIEGWEDLGKPDQVRLVADALRERRDLEPAEVTTRLRPYRLIVQLMEDGELDSGLVDALLREGSATAPLLIGVLRGWAQEFLGDEAAACVESALGLLGEIGDPSAVPHLEEFAGLDDPDLAGAARWAIDRIGELRHGRPAKGRSPHSVYDICAGEVDWEGGGDAFEFVPPPEPVRKAPMPGRNDPCWCGSGKKYKKCHLDADEQPRAELRPAVVGREFASLRSRLGDFLETVGSKRDRRQAVEEFFEDEEPDEEKTLALVDWMIHDWIPPSLGKTVMQEFLRRHGPSLTPRERGLVESWSRSHIGLYEVQEVREGTGLQLKNLLTGGDSFVHDVSSSRQAVRWDGLFMRIVEGERGTEMTGAGLRVPRNQLETLREWIEQDRSRTRLEWPDYLKRNWPRVRRQTLEIAREWYSGLQLRNSDGEDLLFSKSVYRVVDRQKLVASLKQCSELVEDEENRHFAWLRGPAEQEGRTVLGHIRLEGGELWLECNSRQRQAAGRALLHRLAGEALKHLRDEFTTQQEVKRRASEQPPRSQRPKSDIPPEVEKQLVTEVLERHYAKWPDLALPALGGKTPRQAVRDSSGRSKVARLLRDLENGEESKRKAGEPFFDVKRLRAELGIVE